MPCSSRYSFSVLPFAPTCCFPVKCNSAILRSYSRISAVLSAFMCFASRLCGLKQTYFHTGTVRKQPINKWETGMKVWLQSILWQLLLTTLKTSSRTWKKDLTNGLPKYVLKLLLFYTWTDFLPRKYTSRKKLLRDWRSMK